ncbi:MAG: DNA internalization-related competence protein ComEC/Rec2 [Candidatus Rokubacteria bacterium]|nr:DNA internalization-related competence protein ComEC/Rec2 [Candidatus Rokubacteria bacterium]
MTRGDWVAMPAAPLAVAVAIGIAAAPCTPAGIGGTPWAAAIGGGALALVLGRPGWAVGPLLAGVAAIGALRALPEPLPPGHVAHLELPRTAGVEGRLALEPRRFAPGRSRLLLDVERVDGEPRSGRIQVTVYGDLPPVSHGQRVAADCRLHPAQGFRNPGTFDYAAYLRREGIHVVGTAPAERVVPLDARPPPWNVEVRRRALLATERGLPPASAALLGGLLLGDRTRLPAGTDEAFRRAGVYHVLAVSGFNVAIVAAAALGLLGLARLPRSASALAAIGVVGGFALVVGPEPSVLRAALMAVLVLLALLLDRKAAVLNSLALAALVILAVRPVDLGDPGFQLSFAATLAIVAAPLPRGAVGGALAVSAAAQLGVLPITLVHFNQLSTIGVVANLAVVPLAGAATVIGLGAVGLSFMSDGAAAFAFDAVWPILIALRAIVRVAAGVPGALVHLPAPHWTGVAAYGATLALGLQAWRLRGERPRRARVFALAALLAVAAAVLIAAWPFLGPPSGHLRLTVLDVGQGDAIVVEAPDGRALLIDAGAGGPMRLDAGERVVGPFLWNRGILKLALAITTHEDQDHAGGVPAIRRWFAIDETWSSAAPSAAPRSIGALRVTPLGGPGPPATAAGTAERNDAALVLRLEYGRATFLLASDLGPGGERRLLARGTHLGATVLKVAHHGSRRSSSVEFLRAVRPVAAVISVGARNPYGHPDRETLERLAAAGARIFRTDRDGAVIFETDGRVLTVTRWATGARERFCLDPEEPCEARDRD